MARRDDLTDVQEIAMEDDQTVAKEIAMIVAQIDTGRVMATRHDDCKSKYNNYHIVRGSIIGLFGSDNCLSGSDNCLSRSDNCLSGSSDN